MNDEINDRLGELQTKFNKLEKDSKFLQGFLGFMFIVLMILGLIKLFGG